MNCSKCGTDNLPEATFCKSCGEPLTAAVPDLPVAKKKGKSTRFILTTVIIALAVIAGLGFMFRNKVLKQINPERYLQVSLGRTFSDKKNSKILDISKYEKKPTKTEISVESEGVGGEAYVMYDAGGERALFELILDDGDKVYEGNLLYVSRELIALSIPEAITEAKFLTLDPNSFSQDFKDLGMEEEIPPEYMDQVLDMFFGKTAAGKKDMDELTEYFREAKFFEEYADFSKGKSISEEINGRNYNLAAMCYEITEEDANKYLQELLNKYKQGMLDGMMTSYQGYELEGYQASVESAFDVYKNLRIDGDIVITYYIDGNDYVRKVTMDEISLTMKGQEGEIAIEFEMLLGGRNNPTDNISAVLTLSSDGEEVELGMNWDESINKGVYEGELELFAESNGMSEDIGATIEIAWDTKDKKGENFEAELTIDGADGFSIEMTGNLVDDKSSTTFKDGELIINDGYSDEVVVDFDWSISIIDPKEISVDISDDMPWTEYVEQQEAEYTTQITAANY